MGIRALATLVAPLVVVLVLGQNDQQALEDGLGEKKKKERRKQMKMIMVMTMTRRVRYRTVSFSLSLSLSLSLLSPSPTMKSMNRFSECRMKS